MKLFLTLFITCLTTEAFSQLNDSDFKELQKKVVLTVNQLNAVQKELADVKMRKFEPTLRTMKLLYNKIENLNTIIANSKMKGVGALHEFVRLHLEVALDPELAQHVDVAFAATTEVKVLADHDDRRLELIDHHAAHEVSRVLV